MTQTIIATQTYTVVDIRKTFEGFEADLRMIVRRTNKWTMGKADDVFHDVLQLAEAKYLASVDLVLFDASSKVIKATKFVVNKDGRSITSERAGGNDWQDLPNTILKVVLNHNAAWHALKQDGQAAFGKSKGFKVDWAPIELDTTYGHLKKANGQLYASAGYELQKENYS
jgi:hypothetical protein